MVIQQNTLVPVWGTADPGEKVTVVFGDQKQSATADEQGKWIVKLNPLKASDAPAVMTVTGKNTVTLTDILVGEVWVGSGQSNLDTDVPDYVKNDQPLAEAAGKGYPRLRLFRSDVGNGWQETTPQNLRRFSAQLFYFGLKLHQELGVPVGLMEGAVRGSASGYWISPDAFKGDPGIQKAAEASELRDPYETKIQKYDDAMKKWQPAVDAARIAGTPEEKLPKQPVKPTHVLDTPTGQFYEKHIQPMIPYAIRGVLWDQGEGGAVQNLSQRTVMAALIRGWRKDWGQGDFPWLIVQKPSGEGCALDPNNPVNKGAVAFSPLPPNPPGWQPGWPPRWDWLGMMNDNPNIFLVTTSDLATGVHPANKSGYGTRDCQVALGAVYGKPVEFYGPRYHSFTVEGNKLRIVFTHVGKGLTFPKGQALQGFAIAGEDKKFHWAEAVIEGQSIILSSPAVSKPQAARYAWAPFDISWANLFNMDGLPALSFRTED